MTPRAWSVRACLCVLVAWCFWPAAGCTGRASVHMIPLDARRISETSALIVQVTPRHCYYWVNDEQQLCVAMRDFRSSIAGRLRSSELNLSFVLNGVPAATSRDYRVDRDTARLRYRRGLSHTRAASLAGIVGVWGYDGGTLRGRFRFTAKTQSFFALTGWSGNRRALYVGEFRAVNNRAAGESILACTEDDGMARTGTPFGTIPVQGPPRDADGDRQ